MKFNRIVIFFIKWWVDAHNRKYMKTYHVDDDIERVEDIPYIDDGNFYHQFDLFYGNKEKKKNACIIDIHGGAYILGHRKMNTEFMEVFIKEGYDCITVDYPPNKGSRGVKDQMDDVTENLSYIFTHLKELNLENDQFFLTGDSAGGHFALLVTEMQKNPEIKAKFTAKPMDFKFLGILLNAPVYQYENLGYEVLTEGGKKRLYGDNYNDMEERKLLSPAAHIDDLDLPLFLSTCKRDFLRSQPIALHEELLKRNYPHTFIDIDSDKKDVSHVHNVLNINLEESKEVNNAMLDFMNNLL